MARKGEGKAYKWILDHANYAHKDWCLIWPFSRDKHGRGQINFDGERWAHRLMCKVAKGEPPTSAHTAAHSCGKGHEGCVNPWHLDWKTQAENLEDCREHGTLIRHHGGNVRRLLPEQAKAIRDARGFQTQCQLAAKFGVSEGTISDIWHGRTYGGESKIPHWKPEEDLVLRRLIASGKNFSQISKLMGRSVGAVSGYAYRMGMKSGQPVQRITDRPTFSFSNGHQGGGAQ